MSQDKGLSESAQLRCIFTCRLRWSWFSLELANVWISIHLLLSHPQVVSPACGGTLFNGYSSREPPTTASSCGTLEEGKAARCCCRAISAWLFMGWRKDWALGRQGRHQYFDITFSKPCLLRWLVDRAHIQSSFNCFSVSVWVSAVLQQKQNPGFSSILVQRAPPTFIPFWSRSLEIAAKAHVCQRLQTRTDHGRLYVVGY